MYSVIDIESNGGAFRQENIIEVAIYKYDGHEIVDQFISLINPDADISNFVQKLTGITPKMVKTAPRFHEVAKRIIEITDDTTLVGHNIDFDYRMLRQSFKSLGYDFKINTLDTIPLAKRLIPGEKSYSLSKLCKSIGIPLSQAHRAGGDARATLDLLKLLIIKDLDNDIIQSHHEEDASTSYINKIKTLTQDLTSEKGILYFQNSDGKILYSSYVDNLYKAAKKIFNSNSKKHKILQQEVEQVNYELVGHDIIALLVLRSKKLLKTHALHYGLFYKNNQYYVEKFNKDPDAKPYLKFKSFTQGLKAVNFINVIEKFEDINVFEKHINLTDRSEIWTGQGRVRGEKCFLIFDNGKLKFYGFYELYHQIETMSKINKIKIPVQTMTQHLQNELQLALLKGDFEIIPLPTK